MSVYRVHMLRKDGEKTHHSWVDIEAVSVQDAWENAPRIPVDGKPWVIAGMAKIRD